jgi:chemotaxis methyl-accepting protein methylase
MILKEEMADQSMQPRVQIFAGDIDDEALEFARAGRYPGSAAQHISPGRLERLFRAGARPARPGGSSSWRTTRTPRRRC